MEDILSFESEYLIEDGMIGGDDASSSQKSKLGGIYDDDLQFMMGGFNGNKKLSSTGLNAADLDTSGLALINTSLGNHDDASSTGENSMKKEGS